MTASRKRRRNRTIAAFLAGILVLVAAPTMGYAGWQVLKDSKAGKQIEVVPEVQFPSTETSMLAIVDDQNLVVSLAVLVMTPSPATGVPATGGTIVSIPTNSTSAQSFGDANVPIADSVINGGEEGLRSDLESLTRVSLTYSSVMNSAQLVGLLTRIGSISVTLPNDVVTTTAGGSSETLFPAGGHTLTPEQAASILLARDTSQPESRRRPNVHAVWNGISTAVAAGIAPVTPLTDTTVTADDFLDHFLGGPVQVFNDLDTTPISGTNNPDNLDVGSLDPTSVVLLMASLAPSAMLTPYGTLSFRIENGLTQADIDAAGLVGATPADITRDVVAKVLFLHGDIVSVSASVFTIESHEVPDTTIMFTPVDLQPTEIEAFITSLGRLKFEKPRFVFPLVGAVIVIGRTYLADMAALRSQQANEDSTVPAADTVVPLDGGVSGTDSSNVVGTPAVDPTDTVSS
ncbi:MAG: hypothetical protein ABIR32_04330 [Ilumatobacteraceae bacterium]